MLVVSETCKSRQGYLRQNFGIVIEHTWSWPQSSFDFKLSRRGIDFSGRPVASPNARARSFALLHARVHVSEDVSAWDVDVQSAGYVCWTISGPVWRGVRGGDRFPGSGAEARLRVPSM
jgi:hypothetical protein